MGPINCLVYMANNEILKPFVIRSVLDSLGESIPVIRKQFGDRIANALRSAAVVTRRELFVEPVNGTPTLKCVNFTIGLFRLCLRAILLLSRGESNRDGTKHKHSNKK